MKYGTPPGSGRISDIKNSILLLRYDMMKPKGNVQRLAWQVAAENKKLRPKDRLGPRGSAYPPSIDRHIRRLLKERKQHMKRGTWLGPFPP
jgi:hypothetical protein